jgi:hypothetical protein
MAPIRKSFHESALNCCETTLHLYSVFRVVSFILPFSIYRETYFPTALGPVAADSIAAKHGTAGPAQILLRFPVVIITETLMDKTWFPSHHKVRQPRSDSF